MKSPHLFLAVALIALGLWVGRAGFPFHSRSENSAIANDSPASYDGDETSPDRWANRHTEGAPGKHGPERLQAFMLPNVVIDGDTLPEALRKLVAAYEEACMRTGEQPLKLTFVIPPGETKKLKVHLGIRSLNTSVRLLGTLAGMRVSRSGLEYRFDPAGAKTQTIKSDIPLPADFGKRLKKMIGKPAGDDLSEQLAALGIQLDPSTNLTGSGKEELSIETTSSADYYVISALAKLLEDEPRPIQEFKARIIELPADAEFETAESQWLDDNRVGQFMTEVGQLPGAKIWEIPTSGSPNGEPATFEIYNGTFYPTESEEGDVERGQGNLLRLRGSTLGFGNQLNIDFTSENRTFGTNPHPGNGSDDRILLKDEHLYSDDGTRVVVNERADGTKLVLLVDANLSPYHPAPASPRNPRHR